MFSEVTLFEYNVSTILLPIVVMMNSSWDFSQSETEKYFELIIKSIFFFWGGGGRGWGGYIDVGDVSVTLK